MEHSEDDTKSLFVIIKVSRPSDFSIIHVRSVAKGLTVPFLSVCPQIINDLMFFRGTHKKEFDSRWKSFTLVKKSMENRVSWKTRPPTVVTVNESAGDDWSVSSFFTQLHGKKQHIRALLIDRVLLQHEVALTTHTHTHWCTVTHVAVISRTHSLILSEGSLCILCE